MIIDFHTHVLPPQIKENRRRYVDADPSFAGIYSDDKAKIATAEDLIESMDRDGIDVSVIVNYSWSTHEICVETNDYILESVSRYPKRLAGFCAVASFTDAASLKEVERCAQAGVRGVGEIRPDRHPVDFTSKEAMEPLVGLLRKYGLILLLHASEPVGHQYYSKGKVMPEVLYPFVADFPELKVVLPHWGGGLPFYALMPEVESALANTYFDCAATPLLYQPEIFLHLVRLLGEDKVLFGSDFPVVSQQRVLNQIQSLTLPKEAKTRILGSAMGSG